MFRNFQLLKAQVNGKREQTKPYIQKPWHNTQGSMTHPMFPISFLAVCFTLKPNIPVSQAHKRSCKCTLLLIPSVSLFMQLPLPGITFLPLTICAPQDPQILLYVSLCLLFTGLFFPMDS